MIGLRRVLLAFLVFRSVLFLVSGSRRAPREPARGRRRRVRAVALGLRAGGLSVGAHPGRCLTNAWRCAGSMRSLRAGPAAAALRWNSIGPAPMSGGQISSTVVPSDERARQRGRGGSLRREPLACRRHWGHLGPGTPARVVPRTDAGRRSLQAIAFAPSDSRIVYAVTGAELFTAYAYGGAGLLRSWTGASWRCSRRPDLPAPGWIRQLYVAGPRRHTGSRDGDPVPPFPARGILRSTDGGWLVPQTRGGRDGAPGRLDELQPPVRGPGERLRRGRNGVYRSADAEAPGRRWTAPGAAGGVGRVTIAMASSPSISTWRFGRAGRQGSGRGPARPLADGQPLGDDTGLDRDPGRGDRRRFRHARVLRLGPCLQPGVAVVHLFGRPDRRSGQSLGPLRGRRPPLEVRRRLVE
jgi:hypothetical protein